MDILIDFDGTCVSHEFPKIGKEIGAAPVLKTLTENDHNLILFTMRCDFDEESSKNIKGSPTGTNVPGLYLTEAIEWFKKHDIPLYGVQTNPTQHYWTTSPKAYGDIMIDDSAIGIPLINNVEYSRKPFVDWKMVTTLLTKRMLLNSLQYMFLISILHTLFPPKNTV